jgi:hypothetical protein
LRRPYTPTVGESPNECLASKMSRRGRKLASRGSADNKLLQAFDVTVAPGPGSGEELASKIEKNLCAVGLDSASADWLIRALHPALRGRSGVRAPTGGTRETVVLHHVKEVDVAAPPGTTAGWDLLVYSSNTDTTAAVYFTRQTGGQWVESIGPYAFDNTAHGFGSLQNSAVVQGSTKGTSDAGLYSWGKLSVYGLTGLPPPMITAGEDAYFGVHNFTTGSLPIAWRRLSSSITVYNTSSAVFDGGSIVAGCVDALVQTRGSAQLYPIFGSLSTNIAYQNIQVYADAVNPQFATPAIFTAAATPVIYSVPSTVASLVAMNPDVMTAPARDGAYIVTRLDPDFPFVEPMPASLLSYDGYILGSSAQPYVSNNCWSLTTDVVQMLAGSGTEDILSSDLRSHDQIYAFSDVPLSVPVQPGVTTVLGLRNASLWQGASTSALRLAQATQYLTGFADTGFSHGTDRSQTSVVIATNLPPNATMRIKTIVALEVVVSAESIFVPLMDTPAAPSPAALSAYRKLSYLLPQAVGANENGFGTFLSRIWMLVRGAIAPAGRMLLAADSFLSKMEGKQESSQREVQPPYVGITRAAPAPMTITEKVIVKPAPKPASKPVYTPPPKGRSR